MYRRKEYEEKEIQFLYKIEQKHNIFKYSMLSKTPQEIYDACNEIYFYECMYEYFMYNENISKKFMSCVYNDKDIMQVLKHIYNKYEFLSFDKWCDIDEIINCYMQDNGIDF